MFLDPVGEEFVKQDAAKIAQRLPGFVPGIARQITDMAAKYSS